MSSSEQAKVEAFWASYRRSSSVADDGYEVVAFDDDPETATELAILVKAGLKRATASLALPGVPRPQVGGHVVLVDGFGAPQCIWCTTEVRVGSLISVDASFAWDEGEGDRTRESWLETHRRYFARKALACGFEMNDSVEVIFERFEIVWPREFADRR